MLTTVLEILFFPVYLLVRCAEEISGEGRWYRRQRRKMMEERPPLSDDEFIRSINASSADARLWLAVRRAVAEQAGVPADAVYPDDRLADLWRMQLVGPDLIDFQIKMEFLLGKELVLASLTKFLGPVRYGQPGEFRQFAEAVVRGLRESQH